MDSSYSYVMFRFDWLC